MTANHYSDQADNYIKQLEQELEYYKNLYQNTLAEKALAEYVANTAIKEKNDIENATFWKMSKPLRIINDLARKIPTYLHRKQKHYYHLWNLSPQERTVQENTKFTSSVLFSIIVPLYNTEYRHLKQLIDSVCQQTYQQWELCLVDASDTGKDLKLFCEKYIQKDSRIRYKRLDQNYGIAENTNIAISMSSGNYIGLLDHDDLLHCSVLWECMYAIEQNNADFIYTDEIQFSQTPEKAFFPNYKPDYSPDTLRSYNYICHFTVFSRHLYQKTGEFLSSYNGSQDYDMILRLTEQATCIEHIPKVLYFWRVHAKSVAQDISAKPYVIESAHNALSAHLRRLQLNGTIEDSIVPSTYRICYTLTRKPMISILIPNCNEKETLKICIESILGKTTYTNYEIIVIENNSTQPEIFQYYNELTKNPMIKLVTWGGEFNYSAINNFGASHAKGEYLILLNNDIKIISPNWIEEMLMFAQRPDVGAVGIKLYYPNDTIQHAGVFLGIGGVAGHGHKFKPKDDHGYMFRLTVAQNVSAVTAACMMVPSDIFHTLNGLDEKFRVAFNDIDFCMRIRQRDYLIVFTPYAEAYHFESKSRGSDMAPEKTERFHEEINRFHSKWDDILKRGDPYYNPNLPLDSERFYP